MAMRNVMTMMAVMLSLALAAGAATVGPPMTNGPQNTAGIGLTDGQVWQADMSSYADWIADVHFLLGDNGTAGTSDIQYNDAAGFGFSGGHFVISRNANVRSGHVIYKFTLPSGYVTDAGGTVTADTMFNGTPSTQGANLWFGISDTFEPSGAPAYSNLNNPGDFDQLGYDASDGTTYGLYNKSMTLSIPVGVSEFYVAASESPGRSNGRLGIGSLSVDAKMVPEPITLISLLMGGALLRRRG